MKNEKLKKLRKEGLSYAKIADRVGLSEMAVYSRLNPDWRRKKGKEKYDRYYKSLGIEHGLKKTNKD